MEKLDLATVQQLEQIFDERYVLQTDCDDKQANVNKKFANDDKRIEIALHDLKIIKWLVGVVATALTSEVIVAILGMVIK